MFYLGNVFGGAGSYHQWNSIPHWQLNARWGYTHREKLLYTLGTLLYIY